MTNVTDFYFQRRARTIPIDSPVMGQLQVIAKGLNSGLNCSEVEAYARLEAIREKHIKTDQARQKIMEGLRELRDAASPQEAIGYLERTLEAIKVIRG